MIDIQEERTRRFHEVECDDYLEDPLKDIKDEKICPMCKEKGLMFDREGELVCSECGVDSAK